MTNHFTVQTICICAKLWHRRESSAVPSRPSPAAPAMAPAQCTQKGQLKSAALANLLISSVSTVNVYPCRGFEPAIFRWWGKDVSPVDRSGWLNYFQSGRGLCNATLLHPFILNLLATTSVAEPPLIWAAPAPGCQGPGADSGSGSDLLGSAPAPGKKRRLRLHTQKFFILSS